jgi:23S rRNA pseudouridine1911/1915/1917 synthase
MPELSSIAKAVAEQIIFEDNHLIILNKLPSQIVQGDKTGDKPLGELVKIYLKEKYNKPGDVFLAVIHRLDRPVSGVVIFAKTDKAMTRMAKLFQQRAIHKLYWAIVKNKPKQENAHLINFLKKNEAQNKSYVYEKEVAGCQRAELKYRMLDHSDVYYLLEVELMTGKHHQIRAQLAAIGCPIKGDVKYGFARPNQDLSICLHARSISFMHPVRNEEVFIEAPVPADKLWQHFEKKVIVF